MRFNTKTQQQGFTIVELLIVIVVIGILAAITIVAYNGIQNRGKTAAGQALANSVVKKIEAFNTLSSAYPSGGISASTISGYPESKLDDTSSLIVAQGAASDNLSSSTANGGKLVSAWGCAGGANIFYWSYVTNTAQVTKAGAGC